MRIPRDRVETVGREFVYRSLRTSDYRQAIRQARIVAFEVEQMVRGDDNGIVAVQPQPSDSVRGAEPPSCLNLLMPRRHCLNRSRRFDRSSRFSLSDRSSRY